MFPETQGGKGELSLIRRLRGELAGEAEGGAIGFGDDMAAIPSGQGALLWTTDMLMDGTDFDSRRHAWRRIGRKAMAVNLSDCAAMGVEPVAALCAVCLLDGLSMDDALELVRGAQACGKEHRCPIVGGDTNSWDKPTVICITVAARAAKGLRPVRRDGATPGDSVWVSGPLGGSILGRHLDFTPRVALGQRISRELRPHAMIDVSDGLALDLWRILDASSCGAEIDGQALDATVHPDAVTLAGRDGRTPREHALHDGEDFELIVVLPEDAPPQRCHELGLLPLGRIVANGYTLVGPDGRRAAIEPGGWEHFR